MNSIGGNITDRGMYKVYCPFCGKWLFDIDYDVERIVIRCRFCCIKLVILLKEDGPQIFKDRRKKPRT